MHTLEDIFGISGDQLARVDFAGSGTPYPTVSTAANSPYNEPASAISPSFSLADPRNSAMFWIAAMAVLGLVLVTGQIKVEAALGGRAGKGKGKR